MAHSASRGAGRFTRVNLRVGERRPLIHAQNKQPPGIPTHRQSSPSLALPQPVLDRVVQQLRGLSTGRVPPSQAGGVAAAGQTSTAAAPSELLQPRQPALGERLSKVMPALLRSLGCKVKLEDEDAVVHMCHEWARSITPLSAGSESWQQLITTFNMRYGNQGTKVRPGSPPAWQAQRPLDRAR